MEFEREMVRDARGFSRMMKRLEKAERIALDVETTGFDWQNFDMVVGLAVAIPGYSWYVVTQNYLKYHKDFPVPNLQRDFFEGEAGDGLCDFRSDIAIDDLAPVFQLEKPKIFHVANFDVKMIDSKKIADPIHDTMIQAITLFPDRLKRKGSLRLKQLATDFLNADTSSEERLKRYMEKNKITSYGHIPLSIMLPYACDDVEYTIQLDRKFNAALRRRNLEGIYSMEQQLLRYVIEAEEAGAAVDVPYLQELGKKYDEKLEWLEERIKPYGVDPHSDAKQLAFFQSKGFKIEDVQGDTLKKVKHPLAKLLPAHRLVYDLRNKYVGGILKRTIGGRVSMELRQYGARTGRMSCANPNLQNIPGKIDAIRRAFVNPSPKTQMLYIDYKQIEMVILAEMSGDVPMCDAVRSGEDLHDRTAVMLFNEEFTKLERKRAKGANFGTVYGQGYRSLAPQFEMTESQSKRFINRYKATFPGITRFCDETELLVRRQGYVKTLFGRRRNIPAKKAYVGVNARVQGTAADLIKKAMTRVAYYLKSRGYKSRLLLAIHDELWIEHYLNEPIIWPIVKLMTQGYPFELPISVDVDASVTNWAEKSTLTDQVLLDRMAAAGFCDPWKGQNVDWDNIGASGLMIDNPYTRDPFWLVPKKTGMDRAELVA